MNLKKEIEKDEEIQKKNFDDEFDQISRRREVQEHIEQSQFVKKVEEIRSKFLEKKKAAATTSEAAGTKKRKESGEDEDEEEEDFDPLNLTDWRAKKHLAEKKNKKK